MQVRIAKEKAIEILEKQRQKLNTEINEILLEQQQELNTFRTKMENFLALSDEELLKTKAPQLSFVRSLFFPRSRLEKLTIKLTLIGKTTRPTVIFTDEDMPKEA